jgi:hypothetical protein
MSSIKDLKRMCNTIECFKCDLLEWCEEDGRISELPDNVDSIVYRWVKTHPLKTYKDDFFEKFPDAPKTENGIPQVCPANVYPNIDFDEFHLNGDCIKCWDQYMPEDS